MTNDLVDGVAALREAIANLARNNYYLNPRPPRLDSRKAVWELVDRIEEELDELRVENARLRRTSGCPCGGECVEN